MDSHSQLIDYCRDRGAAFLSSAFDLESIDVLNDLGLEIFKIPSGEITNIPYLRRIGNLKKKLFCQPAWLIWTRYERLWTYLQGQGQRKKI